VLSMFRDRGFIAAWFPFAFILSVVWYVDWFEYRKAIESDRMSLADYTQRTASRLTAAVNIRLQLTHLLAAMVTTDPAFALEKFDVIATSLIGDLKGVISLQLAPNGVVTHVTDIARNRGAIGHDLLEDKKRKRLVIRSIDERDYIITGPMTLRQGGEAVIARLPIFTKSSAQDEESFWGFATVLIDVDVLLSEANVQAVDKSIEVALRGKDGRGAKGAVFHGNPEIFDSPAALNLIDLPHGSWQIGVKRKNGLPEHVLRYRLLLWMIGGLLALSCAYGVFYMFRARLEQARIANDLKSTQLQLLQTEKLETIGTLSAGVAHEVKNPLAIIQLGVDYLARKKDNRSDVREVIAGMNEAVQRADTVVKQLVDFSASREVNIREMNVSELMDDSLNMVKHELMRAKIKVNNVIQDHSLLILGDKQKLKQVFINIFMNSIHAMEADGIIVVNAQKNSVNKIDFELAQKEKFKDEIVVITVEDNGSGIPEDKLKNIFEPFFTTKPAGEGTGLGLTVANNIIWLHESEIHYENNGSVGVKVTIIFNAVRVSGHVI
jgi:signal transduction histidine kinase